MSWIESVLHAPLQQAIRWMFGKWKRLLGMSPSPEPVPSKFPDASRTVITQMIRPHHTLRGFALGGEILAWIDVVAGVTAKRHSEQVVVTASMDAVHFFSPVKLGDMIIVSANVNRSWRTSMEIGVWVEAEDMLSGAHRFCCYALLTFVAVKDGKPIPVPELVPLVRLCGD